MSFEVTPLDLENIKKYAARDQIWVINNTDLGRKQSRGDFYLEIVDTQNNAQPIKLPNTWIPVNLVLFAQATDIIRSNNFINAIRRQMLVAISPEEAEAILQRPEAQKEIDKVQELNKHLGAFSLPQSKIAIATSGAGSALAIEAAPTTFQTDNTANTNQELRGLVQRFNNNQIAEDAAVDSLRSLSPPPSLDGLQEATEMVHMKSSIFYRTLAELIGDAAGG